jgi:hypothetical protein
MLHAAMPINADVLCSWASPSQLVMCLSSNDRLCALLSIYMLYGNCWGLFTH